MTDVTTPEQHFVEDFLLKLPEKAMKESAARAALAKLRRGITDPLHSPHVFEVVGEKLPQNTRGWCLNAYLLTACLFGLYAQGRTGKGLPSLSSLPRYRHSFGASARYLRDRLRVGQESLDQRFTALLDCRADDLPVRLRHHVRLMHSHDVPIHFTNLLRDLQEWEPDPRNVRRRWAEQYWRLGDEG